MPLTQESHDRCRANHSHKGSGEPLVPCVTKPSGQQQCKHADGKRHPLQASCFSRFDFLSRDLNALFVSRVRLKQPEDALRSVGNQVREAPQDFRGR